jgi:hypothetical protein
MSTLAWHPAVVPGFGSRWRWAQVLLALNTLRPLVPREHPFAGGEGFGYFFWGEAWHRRKAAQVPAPHDPRQLFARWRLARVLRWLSPLRGVQVRILLTVPTCSLRNFLLGKAL